MKQTTQSEGFGTIGIVIGVAVLAVFGAVAYTMTISPTEQASNTLTTSEAGLTTTNQSDTENMQPEEMTESESDVDVMATAESAATESDDMATDTGVELAVEDAVPLAAGIYTEYDPSLLANAENGDVLIFFHAAWCPSCRGLENDITANLETIPDGVTILKVDYDTETELKKKYGVTRQHTLVHVDANGEEIKKIRGLTNTLDQVVQQI